MIIIGVTFCLCVLYAYAQHYTLRTLPFEDADYVSTTPNYFKVSANISSDIQKCFTVTTDPYGCVLSGDVPTDVKISLTHNGKSSLQHYLHGGDNNIITIEGLSPNMEIQSA